MHHRNLVQSFTGKIFYFTLFLCLQVAILFGKELPHWPHAYSDIPLEDKVHLGHLENGLRYVIIPNNVPLNRVSLRLIVEAGSLMEADNQLGMAHFLEHMAFNGTKNFAGDEVVKYFQRLGMSFGADTNAHTGFDETVYQLELPSSEDVILHDGLKLMRDYVDGMSLLEDEIERERGVILSEKLTRDSIEYRTFKAELDHTLGDSLISKRHPIGTEESLKTMPKEEFVKFYEKWYRTDRIIFLAVGDFKVDAVEAMIHEHFKSLQSSGPEIADPDLGSIQEKGFRPQFHPEPEATFTSISLQTVRRDQSYPDTIVFRKKGLEIKVANMILNKRLDKIAKSGKYKISKGLAYYNRWLDFVHNAGIEIRCDPSEWGNAIHIAEQEIRRALKYGFTESEVQEAASRYVAAYQSKANAKASRSSRDIANDFVKKWNKGLVYSDPVKNYEIGKAILEKMTAEDCIESLRSVWSIEERALFVTGNLVLNNPIEKITEAYKQSQQITVEAPVEQEIKEFAYSKAKIGGHVVERIKQGDLGITQLRFENNVRVNLKTTTFEKGKVRIYARFGAGILTLPKDQNGLALIAQNTFINGGLGKHGKEEIDQIYAGKTVNLSFTVEEDCFHISGDSASSDIADALLLLQAYITDPGYREESYVLAQQMLDRLYLQLDRTPEGVVANGVASFLASHDYRFGFPAKEMLGLRSLNEVKDWLTPYLKYGYLEVSFVGDFEMESMVEKLSHTLGVLPMRDPYRPSYTKERQLKFPNTREKKMFPLDSKIQKAFCQVYWPTNDLSDISRSRRLNILASILMDRMREKVREEIGEAYSPVSKSKPSPTFTNYGYLYASLSCKPDQAENLSEVILDIGEILAKDGITEDELVRAKKPLLSGLEVWLKNNQYWLIKVLGNCQENSERLDWTRNIESDIASINKGEIESYAKKYLQRDKGVVVLVIPDKE